MQKLWAVRTFCSGMPEGTRKYPSQYLLGKLEGALSDNQERARNRMFEKVRLVEQHGGRTRGDARLDRGMQESILVPSSASDVGSAPADQNKEEQLLEQQGGRTCGDARLDRGMLETILVPSSASDVNAASTDLFEGNIGREKQYPARQFEDVKNTRWEVGHWLWKHQRQKLGMEPTQKTQEAVVPQKSPRCDQRPDDYG